MSDDSPRKPEYPRDDKKPWRLIKGDPDHYAYGESGSKKLRLDGQWYVCPISGCGFIKDCKNEFVGRRHFQLWHGYPWPQDSRGLLSAAILLPHDQKKQQQDAWAAILGAFGGASAAPFTDTGIRRGGIPYPFSAAAAAYVEQTGGVAAAHARALNAPPPPPALPSPWPPSPAADAAVDALWAAAPSGPAKKKKEPAKKRALSPSASATTTKKPPKKRKQANGASKPALASTSSAGDKKGKGKQKDPESVPAAASPPPDLPITTTTANDDDDPEHLEHLDFAVATEDSLRDQSGGVRQDASHASKRAAAQQKQATQQRLALLNQQLQQTQREHQQEQQQPFAFRLPLTQFPLSSAPATTNASPAPPRPRWVCRARVANGEAVLGEGEVEGEGKGGLCPCDEAGCAQSYEDW
ncbi:uncharacterized protein AB675_8830 [Cyphellophora attinorum]|uniref:Uncharacterized protein n=1 Tax=Cyphellophora attinorum TaxID=1664694 RepID=A0A0N0NR26_9EURO|nr:uncharacterized protein AB675_8830 [Phialophora attinorum]KPI44598.1 hypothetical protein AB675_8830 [Phialophora attinorum]